MMKFKSLKVFTINVLLINIFTPYFFNFNREVFSQDLKEPNAEYLKQKPKFNQYILGPGDVILVEVIPEKYNQNPVAKVLNNVYSIDGEGLANFKRLNNIYISGLTVTELENILNKEYKKFVKYPEVDVTVVKYRPITVYLEGEINDPGVHNLKGSYGTSPAKGKARTLLGRATTNLENSEELLYQLDFEFIFPTLFDAIRIGGGITRFSDLDDIEVIRKNSISNGGGLIKTSISLFNILDNFNSNQNIRIYDGDTIVVKKAKEPALNQISKAIKSNLNPRTMNVFVSGRVETPGNIEVPKSSTLSDALDIAGGVKVVRGPVRFLRINPDGEFEKRVFNYRNSRKRGSYQNPYLQSGDLIIVGKNKLNIANEIIKDLTAPFVGIYSTIGVFKEISD